MDSRQQIRRVIRQQREQLSLAFIAEASTEICRYIINSAWFRRSKHIAFYQPVRGEVDPTLLLQRAWDMGKTCYLPVCHPLHHSSLWFLPYFPEDSLIPNRYGILEPCSKKRPPCKPLVLDTVFMPLVAFDAQGNRLGSGKGYYDRTFAYLRRFPEGRKPALVGLAYAFQQVDCLIPKVWDIPLDDVVVGGSNDTNGKSLPHD